MVKFISMVKGLSSNNISIWIKQYQKGGFNKLIVNYGTNKSQLSNHGTNLLSLFEQKLLMAAFEGAALGLPYAFASHFAPSQFVTAINLYRQNFRPSASLQKPYLIDCVNVVAADTDAEANRLATTLQQLFLGVITGRRRLMQPPVENINAIFTEEEVFMVKQMLAYSFIGSPKKIAPTLQYFLAQTRVDEVMAVSHIYDQDARLRSYQIFVGVMKNIAQ